MCTPLRVVHQLARMQSQRLIETRNRTRYDVHGLFGIFGNGDTIAGKPGKRYFTDYSGVKVAFMHREACRMIDVATVCETGFCAGLSALLMLETLPHARVLSFDLGDLPWARAADKMLRSHYGTERFPGVVFGDATATISRYHAQQPFTCDAVFVDGDKSYTGRYNAMVKLRSVSRNGTAVFMDEVTTEPCLNGTFATVPHEHHCRHLNKGYWPSVRAYNRASREGWLRIERCVWPPFYPYDGICLARFLF